MFVDEGMQISHLIFRFGFFKARSLLGVFSQLGLREKERGRRGLVLRYVVARGRRGVF